MPAQLIAPDGTVTELTDEEYWEIRIFFCQRLPTRSERMNALLNLLDETNKDLDEEWWAELEQLMEGKSTSTMTTLAEVAHG